jgi:hypothetical protein
MMEAYVRVLCFLLGPDVPVPYDGHRRDLRCKRCRRRIWPHGNTFMHVNERGYLTEEDDPVLARIWDNEADAIFDEMNEAEAIFQETEEERDEKAHA